MQTNGVAMTKGEFDKNFLSELYKEMLFYRRFEEKVGQAYMKQKFSGFCHLHIGQEAVCVGVAKALQANDYLVSGYRSHTQAISKGVEATQVFAELFGRSTGCSHGKGGSMHLFSREHRFLGGHGIVGGQAPIAVGVGFAIKYQEANDIVVCMLGDAAMNQGAVFEAMNMAAVWKLPVLFLIENNRYGMGTDIARTTSIDQLYKRALAFDMQHGWVDGMNVRKVYQSVSAIVDKIRGSNMPYLLEAKTSRFKGHSVSDPGTYRTKEQLKKEMDLDPILELKNDLLKQKIVSEEQFKNWDVEVKERVRDAQKHADEAPVPEEKETWSDVYADV